MYGWDGYDYDAATKLYFDNARVYDPVSQRWMSQDPMGDDAGDSNLFRYVNNAPTDARDPSGFQEEQALSEANQKAANDHFWKKLQQDPSKFGLPNLGKGKVEKKENAIYILAQKNVAASLTTKEIYNCLNWAFSEDKKSWDGRIKVEKNGAKDELKGSDNMGKACIALDLPFFEKLAPGYDVLQTKGKIDLTAKELQGRDLVALFGSTKFNSGGKVVNVPEHISHAAKKGANDKMWTSKLGSGFLIEHENLTQLEGGDYGDVFAILGKKVKGGK